MGGGDALGLHADLKGCRVQLSGSCRERLGSVERKEVEVATERVLKPRS